IRDFHVTGVQTCALPIFASAGSQGAGHGFGSNCDQVDVKKHTGILGTVSPLPLSFYLRVYAVSDCLPLRWVARQPLSSWRYGCVAYMVATVSGSDSQ